MRAEHDLRLVVNNASTLGPLPMRALAEHSMVIQDWFELFIVQNLLIDGTGSATREDSALLAEAV